ncbi:MAG: GatB/YqeY domain-containing protein [Dehalococcoidia bacterium]|nr:MAG: GatB/YqeY domain-containing protein [Dehalococcoidia bacterium]
MATTESIRDAMTAAWKAGDTTRRDALRLMIASMTNARIELGRPLDEADVTRVLQKEAKQRRDSIAEYAKAKRQDLVDKEQAELDVIVQFLPQQMSEEELRAIVRSVIEEAGAKSVNDLGKVMRPLMARLAGRADGAAANAIAREILQG